MGNTAVLMKEKKTLRLASDLSIKLNQRPRLAKNGVTRPNSGYTKSRSKKTKDVISKERVVWHCLGGQVPHCAVAPDS